MEEGLAGKKENFQRPWKKELGDILDEVKNHTSSEQYAYTLFRIKNLYNKAKNEKDKETSSKLFLDVKDRVEKLIKIDIKEFEAKHDKERVNSLKELASKVKTWTLE